MKILWAMVLALVGFSAVAQDGGDGLVDELVPETAVYQSRMPGLWQTLVIERDGHQIEATLNGLSFPGDSEWFKFSGELVPGAASGVIVGESVATMSTVLKSVRRGACYGWGCVTGPVPLEYTDAGEIEIVVMSSALIYMTEPTGIITAFELRAGPTLAGAAFRVHTMTDNTIDEAVGKVELLPWSPASATQTKPTVPSALAVRQDQHLRAFVDAKRGNQLFEVFCADTACGDGFASMLQDGGDATAERRMAVKWNAAEQVGEIVVYELGAFAGAAWVESSGGVRGLVMRKGKGLAAVLSDGDGVVTALAFGPSTSVPAAQ